MAVFLGSTDTDTTSLSIAVQRKIVREWIFWQKTLVSSFRGQAAAKTRGKKQRRPYPQLARLELATDLAAIDCFVVEAPKGIHRKEDVGKLFRNVLIQSERPGLLLPDHGAWVANGWAHEYSNSKRERQRMQFLPTSPESEIMTSVDEPVVPMSHHDGLNWYHFLVDLVPAIWRAEQDSQVTPIFALSAKVRNSPNHYDVVDAVLPASRQFLIQRDRIYRAEHALLTRSLRHSEGTQGHQVSLKLGEL